MKREKSHKYYETRKKGVQLTHTTTSYSHYHFLLPTHTTTAYSHYHLLLTLPPPAHTITSCSHYHFLLTLPLPSNNIKITTFIASANENRVQFLSHSVRE
jgi:hypothetical protein